ncbi:MAG TPA: PaaI family thioesterase [Chitinophagales bacterium]|nr:PaaI family thioesterase [Chitinophagales bacterium]
MNNRIAYFRSHIGKEKWSFDYPMIEWMKAQVLEADEGIVKLQFTVKDYMLNPLKIMHGGVASTMLDELMGAACFLMNKPVGYVTINMNVDYLSAAKENDILIGEGKVIRAGRTTMHAEARIYNTEGKLLFKSSGNFMATQTPLPT